MERRHSCRRGRRVGGRNAAAPGLRRDAGLWFGAGMEEPHFFNPWQEVEMGKNRLPHWHQDGGVYFVTFRLADSWPEELLAAWREERERWRKRLAAEGGAELEAEYQRLYFRRMEEGIDQGHGSCVLRRAEVADVVARALLHHEGSKTRMLGFVVMPNHVHAVFGLVGGAELSAVVGAWKGFSSFELGRRLGAEWPGWQKDYFDRLVRDETHFGRCVRYVRGNPVKAGLRAGECVLWESERARAVG